MENETDSPAQSEDETDPSAQMENETDPLVHFGLEAIDLRWTLKHIAAKRAWMINQQHLAQLIDLGLVEMREDVLYLTNAGQDTVWRE